MDPLFIAIYRHFVQAQTASNKTSLTAVMTTIEQQFNVKFSYAVEDSLHQHRKTATDLTSGNDSIPQLKSTFEL
jgi:hypothetical protein